MKVKNISVEKTMPRQCMMNVYSQIENKGGEMVPVWMIPEQCKDMKIFHVIWKDKKGVFYDITPRITIEKHTYEPCDLPFKMVQISKGVFEVTKPYDKLDGMPFTSSLIDNCLHYMDNELVSYVSETKSFNDMEENVYNNARDKAYQEVELFHMKMNNCKIRDLQRIHKRICKNGFLENKNFSLEEFLFHFQQNCKRFNIKLLLKVS